MRTTPDRDVMVSVARPQPDRRADRPDGVLGRRAVRGPRRSRSPWSAPALRTRRPSAARRTAPGRSDADRRLDTATDWLEQRERHERGSSHRQRLTLGVYRQEALEGDARPCEDSHEAARHERPPIVRSMIR